MRSNLYIDEYSLIDVTYLVHAFPFSPGDEHEDAPQQWSIGLLFHVGTKAQHSALVYPTREHRDKAFEALCAMAAAAHSVQED